MTSAGGLPYFKVFADDLIGTVAHTGESPDVTGARLRMWCHACKESPTGTLPNDEGLLKYFSGLSTFRWKKVRNIILGGWVKNPAGDRWIIRRIVEEAEHVHQLSDAGRTGATARWGSKTDATATQIAMPSHIRSQCLPPPPLQPQPKREEPPVVPHRGTSARPRRKRTTPKTNSYTPDFEIIWRPYPNGGAKREAAEEWIKVKRMTGRHAGEAVPSLGLLLQTYDWKMQTPIWSRDDCAFVEQLQKFLRHRRWEDEPDGGIRKGALEEFEQMAAKRYEELTAEKEKP